MASNAYFDSVADPRWDQEIIENATQRSLVRSARERLDRLEEIRDVALLRRVQSVDDVSRSLQLDLRYVERPNRLIELWRAGGRDPFDSTSEELVLAAFLDHGMNDLRARRDLVEALCAIITTAAAAAKSEPAAGHGAESGVEPGAGHGAESGTEPTPLDRLLAELRSLHTDGFLTQAELDQVLGVHRAESARGTGAAQDDSC